MTRTFIAGGVAALALAAAAQATTYTGSGGAIPDNAPTTGLMSEIVINDHFFIKDLVVTLNGLTHTWFGDLSATVTHVETGDTFSLFNRPGKTNATLGFGESSDAGGNYSFNDFFTGDLWAAGLAGGSAFVVPGGNYFATGALSGAQVNFLPALLGDDAFGTWRLNITDSAGGDLGTLGSWGLSFIKTPVPAPGAFALLGLAGLAGRRRRQA